MAPGYLLRCKNIFEVQKNILICKKNPICKKNISRKQDGCGPWLLTLCLGRNLSRLVAHAGVAKLDLKSIWYLKKAKRNKKSNDLFLHCHCSNYVSCQNRQTSPKKGEAATKEEATRRGATSWWIFHRNVKYSKDFCSFCQPAACGPVGLPCLPAWDRTSCQLTNSWPATAYSTYLQHHHHHH